MCLFEAGFELTREFESSYIVFISFSLAEFYTIHFQKASKQKKKKNKLSLTTLT